MRSRVFIYPRQTTRKHWDDFRSSPVDILKSWCRKNKVLMGALIRGMIKFFPSEWEDLKNHVGELMFRKCDGCGLDFYANAKKQRFCKESCGKNIWSSLQTEYRKSALASKNVTKDPSR